MMSTPSPVRRSISACTISATFDITATLRGLEMKDRSGVVAPMMPMLRPCFSTTVDGAIRPCSTSAASAGSPEKSRLALMNGAVVASEMNRANRSGPKSNSWLPMVRAS